MQEIFPFHFILFLFMLLCDTTMHARGSRPCTSVLPVSHLDKSLKALRLGTRIHKNHKHIKYPLKKKYRKSVHLEFTVSTTWSDNIHKMSPCWLITSCRSFSFYCSAFVTLWCHWLRARAPGLCRLDRDELDNTAWSVSSDPRTFYILQLCK